MLVFVFTVLVCSLEWDVPYPAPLSPLCVCVYYTSVISLSFSSLSLSFYVYPLPQTAGPHWWCAVFLGLLQPPRRVQPDPIGFGRFYPLKKNKFYSLLSPLRKHNICVRVCAVKSRGKKIRKNGVHLLFHAGRYDGWVQLNLFAAYGTFFRFFNLGFPSTNERPKTNSCPRIYV